MTGVRAAVRRYVDLSTVHVPPGLLAELPRLDSAIFYANPFGGFLWVPGDLEGWLADHEELPEPLVAIWRYARARGCEFVSLDCDADPVDDLEQYDWPD